MENLRMKNTVMAELEVRKESNPRMKVGGRFEYECYDTKGNLKWKDESHNTITGEGIGYLLDEVFGTASKVNTWYVGLYTALSGTPGDLTGADIGGGNLTEFTDYTGNRKAFAGVRSGQSWSNAASKAEFVISSGNTILGAFLASDEIGTATYLLCIDTFSGGSRAVSPSDTLKVAYVFNMANV